LECAFKVVLVLDMFINPHLEADTTHRLKNMQGRRGSIDDVRGVALRVSQVKILIYYFFQIPITTKITIISSDDPPAQSTLEKQRQLQRCRRVASARQLSQRRPSTSRSTATGSGSCV
jgi:hypothetical protein